MTMSGDLFDIRLLKREDVVFLFSARFANTRLSDFWISI